MSGLVVVGPVEVMAKYDDHVDVLSWCCPLDAVAADAPFQGMMQP